MAQSCTTQRFSIIYQSTSYSQKQFVYIFVFFWKENESGFPNLKVFAKKFGLSQLFL